jgi:uncharacterized membrane protein YdjX (TVP38/TMEM64 family)
VRSRILRWGGKSFVLRHYPRTAHVAHFFARGGIPAVVIVRQMPVAGFLINILLGLTHVRHRDFLAGTVLGILPEAVPATLIGSGAVLVSAPHSAAYITLAVAGLVVVWIALGWFIRHSKSETAEAVRASFKHVTDAPGDGTHG